MIVTGSTERTSCGVGAVRVTPLAVPHLADLVRILEELDSLSLKRNLETMYLICISWLYGVW